MIKEKVTEQDEEWRLKTLTLLIGFIGLGVLFYIDFKLSENIIIGTIELLVFILIPPFLSILINFCWKKI